MKKIYQKSYKCKFCGNDTFYFLIDVYQLGEGKKANELVCLSCSAGIKINNQY